MKSKKKEKTLFPLIIKYKRELTVNIESQQVFNLIEKELIRLGVDKFKHSDLEINFKNSFFNGQGRWNLMAPVDKGYFKLDRKLWKLEYSFSVIRTFFITLAFSFFFGLISQSYKFGIIIFLWSFGMNWIITLIRQNVFMNKLKRKLIEKNTTHNTV